MKLILRNYTFYHFLLTTNANKGKFSDMPRPLHWEMEFRCNAARLKHCLVISNNGRHVISGVPITHEFSPLKQSLVARSNTKLLAVSSSSLLCLIQTKLKRTQISSTKSEIQATHAGVWRKQTFSSQGVSLSLSLVIYSRQLL